MNSNRRLKSGSRNYKGQILTESELQKEGIFIDWHDKECQLFEILPNVLLTFIGAGRLREVLIWPTAGWIGRSYWRQILAVL